MIAQFWKPLNLRSFFSLVFLLFVWFFLHQDKVWPVVCRKRRALPLNSYRELCPLLQDLMAEQCGRNGSLHPALPIAYFTSVLSGWPICQASSWSPTSLIYSRIYSGTISSAFRRWVLTVCRWRVDMYGRSSFATRPAHADPVHWKRYWSKWNSYPWWS